MGYTTGYKIKLPTLALVSTLFALLLSFAYPYSIHHYSYGISDPNDTTYLFHAVQVYVINQTNLEFNFTNITNNTSINDIFNYTNASNFTSTYNGALNTYDSNLTENTGDEYSWRPIYLRYFTVGVNSSTRNAYVGNTISLSAILPSNILDISSNEFIQYKWIRADGSSCPGFQQQGFGDSSNTLNYTPSGNSSSCIFGVFVHVHLNGQGDNENGQSHSCNNWAGSDCNLFGYGESNSIRIQEKPQPLNATGISVSSNPIDFNQQITLKAAASGGVPSYSGKLFAAYNSTTPNAFAVANQLCSTSSNIISCTFTNTNSTRRSGSFFFKIMVTDSAGNSINTSISKAVKIESMSIFPNKITINSGANVLFTNDTGPGSDSYTNFTYVVSPSNGVIERGNNFTFNLPGNYSVMLTAQSKTQDSSPPANETVEANAIVTVLPALTF